MNYSIVKIRFKSKARFGIRNLENTFKICHSDTLFSAIFIEIMKLYGINEAKKFKSICENGKIKISSTMPYFFDEFEEDYRLFLPKPIIYINNEKDIIKVEDFNIESLKKILKKIEFLRVSDFMDYLKQIKEHNEGNMYYFENRIIDQTIDIKVNLEKQPSQIYNIASNVYLNKLENDEIEIDGIAGLYFIIEYEEKKDLEIINNILKSLQYDGLGGKRSIGYGKFQLKNLYNLDESTYDDEKKLYQLIKKSESSQYKMLISLLSPKKDEIEDFDSNNYYSLIKRGGFVFSNNYSTSNMKKKEIYMIEEGSTLTKKYFGDIKNLATNGQHEVYRYGLGMYVGFDI